MLTQPEVDEHQRQQDTDAQLHPRQVEGDDVGGKEQCQQGEQHRAACHPCRHVAPVGVDGGHARGEELDEQKHDELADGGGHVAQHDVGETQPDDEVDHGADAREEERAGHAFAVEHEEEGEEHEGGPGLFLQDDDCHGQEDKPHDAEEVAPAAEGEAVGVHELGEGEGGGCLGELGRLDVDAAAEAYPGVGALDVAADKEGGDEQEDDRAVDDVGEQVVELLFEHEEHKADAEGTANPQELLSCPRVHAEEVGLSVGVAGSADTEPSADEQGEIEGDDDPVDRFVKTSVAGYHRRCVVVGFRKPAPRFRARASP